jgi:flagellar biosynthesis GTPase FlhF
MSEENDSVDTKDTTATDTTTDTSSSGKTYSETEVQQLIDEQVRGLKGKVEELLSEKKSASQRAKELEEEQKRQEEDRMAEKQQFKELYEREQKSKQELQEQYEEFQNRIRQQEIGNEALKLSSELTRDNARGELLQEKAMQYAKYSEDGVTFELGGVPVDKDKILSHLREKYPFLVDGSGATGGGAAGSNNGGAVVTKSFSEMSGAELSELRAESPQEYQRLRDEFYGQR